MARACDEYDGVNVAGYLRTESGVGTATRGYIRGFQALHMPMTLHDLSALTGNRSEDPTLRQFDDSHPYHLSLVCADVEPHYAIVSRLGPEFFRGHHSIGVWAWELPHFPSKWLDRFEYYDEIWVGTSFIANALASVAPVPVVRIPPVLTPIQSGSRERGRIRLGVAANEFVFLFVFDFHSHVQRKNPMAVIEAFKSAFSPSDPARLVLKCVNAHSSPEGLADMEERSRGQAISIYDGYWPVDEVRDLMEACDAYVSLHRSEGTGLTITDAMAVGKPVIATGWSGNMEFMSVGNSYPVQYELVEIAESVGPYHAGEAWAEPSVEHAASLLRQVFDHPDEAQRRGEAARREIAAGYSDHGVARLIEQRLGGIRRQEELPKLRQVAWTNFAEYQALGRRIHDHVASVVPRQSTVIVVSKGDEALMPHDVCRAWHFPRTDDGEYAGSYPANSAEAIAHLESLRAQGGEYLVFPRPALWWLDHYVDFRHHLNAHYRQLARDEDSCLIYALEETVQ